jgi:hypothetical protein
MPRLRGESSNGTGAFITILGIAVLAAILLEYYGVIDLLPGVGLI